MEISNKDNTKLEEMFKNINDSDNIECELLIKKEIYPNNFINLLNIIKNITGNEYEERDILDISFINNNIRTTIVGKENIELYCKTNKIKDIDEEYIIETFKRRSEGMNQYKFEYDKDIIINLKVETDSEESPYYNYGGR